MKWLEQNLSGLRIIFLHDLFTCHKCINAISSEDFGISLNKSIPQINLNDWNKLCKCFQSKNNILLRNVKEPLKQSKGLLQKKAELSPGKIKVLNRKKFRSPNSQEFHKLPLKNYFENKDEESIKSPQKSGKKKSAAEGNARTSIKKQATNPDKKLQESKIPGKGTLKRRRWFLSKLNHKNDNYEDDLFEDKKFAHFQNLFEDETDSAEKYEDLKTPVFPFSISPRENTPSPTFKDYYSPTELSRSRKGAEEYQYRRRKRRKLCFAEDKVEEPPTDPQSREADVRKRLEEVARILDQQKERSSDSEEDQYFSDMLDIDNSSKVKP